MTGQPGMRAPQSLKLRLMAAAALWALPVLVLAGMLLHWAFLTHLERQIDAELAAYQRELLAAARIDDLGVLQLAYVPADPRFSRPLSGWYWQAAQDGRVMQQSLSAGPLGPGALPLLTQSPGIIEMVGPGGRELRIFTSDVALPGTDRPITIVVAAPCDEIDADLNQFSLHILVTFLVLGAAFLMAVYLQVGFGLRPLASLRREIAAIRGGRADRLTETFPGEIAPVVEEVNALIDHNRQLLERARNEAGNLAHALKNPLSVLAHEITTTPAPQRAVLGQQVEQITAQVERILKRIRTAGPSAAGHARTPLTGICDDLVFSLGVIYRERDLKLSADAAPDLIFAGDAEDLAEMIGNLADNACKWAGSRVAISAARKGDRLEIVIEDDGPGIAADARAAVLGRGQRLDERVPGSGLGLDIVREIATLYRGDLALTGSALGGLRVELDLPAA
jgi:signal transduction histidine kinase